VNAYTLAFAALILTAGALGDRIGAKRVFLAGFAVFTAASLTCALAPTLGVFIAARAVQGVGAAILVPSSLALLNHTYPDDEGLGRAVAIWAAGASLGLTAGPLFGGALIAATGWRSIFLVNVPIGMVGLILAFGFSSFVVAFGLFVFFEWRAKYPMLPLSLFRSRAFSVTSVAGLLVNVAF
jgi:DHA2 family methylenomycin A resistance protein-like MFS transporter